MRVWARLHEWGSLLSRGALNLTQVAPKLWVGGAIPRSRYGELRILGVDAVIDLREEAKDDAAALAELGIELLHLPAKDRFAASAEQLLRGVDWALPRLAAERGVFVHCQHGVGRGPLMGVALLVAQGATPDDAYAQVRQARWQVALNDRQLAGLSAFIEAWRARVGFPSGAASP